MTVGYVILTIVLSLLLILTGSGKLLGTSSSHQIRDSLGVGGALWKLIGAFELLPVVLLVAGIRISPSAILGATCACVLFVGATVSRLRAGGLQAKRGVPVDIALLLISIATRVLAVLR